MGDVITGGCLCGGVRYEVHGRFLRASHCHCSRCRRHSGAAMCTQGRVHREDFRLLRGADLIRTYRPDGGAVKAFCSVCGSSLFGGTWPEGTEVSIRLGTIDGDPGIRPQFHTFVGSKAPWDEITDDLPQYPGPWSAHAEPFGPPAAPMACDLSALDDRQRERRADLAGTLRLARREVTELPNGYAFSFDSNSATLQQLAEFASLEGLCCPFLRFELHMGAAKERAKLVVSGRGDVKPFLAAALGIHPTER